MPDCVNCGHPEEDHVGYRSGGELIPGKLCYHEENQGYCEDLCTCPGFDVRGAQLTYFETLLAKAGSKEVT